MSTDPINSTEREVPWRLQVAYTLPLCRLVKQSLQTVWVSQKKASPLGPCSAHARVLALGSKCLDFHVYTGFYVTLRKQQPGILFNLWGAEASLGLCLQSTPVAFPQYAACIPPSVPVLVCSTRTPNLPDTTWLTPSLHPGLPLNLPLPNVPSPPLPGIPPPGTLPLLAIVSSLYFLPPGISKFVCVLFCFCLSTRKCTLWK